MSELIQELVNRLMENEMAIGRLYEQFGETFSEDEKFWKEISREELLHFNWLKQLGDFVKKEKIGTRPTSLRSQPVSTSINYINSLIEKCRKGELTREKAYALAYDIENSLLEKHFFSIFEFASTPYRKIQSEMSRETRDHRDKIGEALKKIRDAKTS
jgi:hypothetical protein